MRVQSLFEGTWPQAWEEEQLAEKFVRLLSNQEVLQLASSFFGEDACLDAIALGLLGMD